MAHQEAAPVRVTKAPADNVTLRESVRQAIARAWSRAQAEGALPDPGADVDRSIDVDRPANEEHGDFATNLALRLARPLRMAPPAIASALVAELRESAARDTGSPIATATAAGPGFVNVTVREAVLETVAGRALAEPDAWGRREPGEDREWAVGRWASDRIRAGIEASLERLGVRFDVWTTEGSLVAEGWVDRAVERLRAGGHLYEQDGATWFRSTAFGDDKDRVVFRSDGSPTYFAFDAGYLVHKFSRGFDHLIFVWGPDHHGTVARVRNAAEAMGYGKAAVEMILTGWVRFIRDGVELSMSKRAGAFITLDELLEDLGVDAARWYFASRGANVNMDLDMELARRQSSENPVYYVQYAHARIASILRKAAEAGLARAGSLDGALAGEDERRLARVVARYPEVVEDAAAAQETHSITTYATELATAFHGFYRDARVVDPDEPGRSAARLALVEAARVTLANALGLLGISAPESM